MKTVKKHIALLAIGCVLIVALNACSTCGKNQSSRRSDIYVGPSGSGVIGGSGNQPYSGGPMPMSDSQSSGVSSGQRVRVSSVSVSNRGRAHPTGGLVAAKKPAKKINSQVQQAWFWRGPASQPKGKFTTKVLRDVKTLKGRMQQLESFDNLSQQDQDYLNNALENIETVLEQHSDDASELKKAFGLPWSNIYNFVVHGHSPFIPPSDK